MLKRSLSYNDSSNDKFVAALGSMCEPVVCDKYEPLACNKCVPVVRNKCEHVVACSSDELACSKLLVQVHSKELVHNKELQRQELQRQEP
jgi:hypothetical protein